MHNMAPTGGAPAGAHVFWGTTHVCCAPKKNGGKAPNMPPMPPTAPTGAAPMVTVTEAPMAGTPEAFAENANVVRPLGGVGAGMRDMAPTGGAPVADPEGNAFTAT
jgi:hypothetical protein